MTFKELVRFIKEKRMLLPYIQKRASLTPMGSSVYGCQCPHPDHEDSTASFRVWEESQSWACMGCHCGKTNPQEGNYGNDIFAFARWMSQGKLGFRQSVMQVARELGIQEGLEIDPDLEYNQKLGEDYKKRLNPYILEYLEKRGMDDEDLVRYGIGFDGARIVFPLLDIDKQLIGFCRRCLPGLGDQDPKYLNSSESHGFKKRGYLYGIHELDMSYPYVFLVEGPMDRILGTKMGMKNVLASLGTAFTEEHAITLAKIGKTPVLVADRDEAGMEAVRKSAMELSRHGVFSLIYVPEQEKEDLADFCLRYKGDNIGSTIIQNSQPHWMYLLEKPLSLFDSRLIELRQQYTPALRQTLMAADPSEWPLIQDYIRQRTGISL